MAIDMDHLDSRPHMSNDMSQMQIVEQQVSLHNALTLETLISSKSPGILAAIDMDHLHSRLSSPTIVLRYVPGEVQTVEQWALETLT